MEGEQCRGTHRQKEGKDKRIQERDVGRWGETAGGGCHSEAGSAAGTTLADLINNSENESVTQRAKG